MTRATTARRRAPTGRTRWLIRASLLLALIVIAAPGPGFAGAGVSLKSGKYSGKTAQDAVSPSFRKIEFVLKKGKVTLTTEPTVARGPCLSTPVFTLDGTVTKKLGRDRSFTFTHTFLGNKFDKISGHFVSSTEVEGFAIYHFAAQDLCSEGKTKVSFTAKHK